ncbi:hypothetical protein [Desulfovibrio sp. TomC]|uniref:hypothetical protein n=1 Tax=Desulfovibrio sp. TomC TaxID=1562888 RepID=UPI0012E2701E|nr:hypothetical protein [Desulfovibrio sp. TomC]
MNGPASPLVCSPAQPPMRLAHFDEREVAGHGTRFWELTLHKTSVGGYILETVMRGSRPQDRPLAAALSFGDIAALLDFLGAPDVVSPLAEGLLDRAAGLDPALGPRGTP